MWITQCCFFLNMTDLSLIYEFIERYKHPNLNNDHRGDRSVDAVLITYVTAVMVLKGTDKQRCPANTDLVMTNDLFVVSSVNILTDPPFQRTQMFKKH